MTNRVLQFLISFLLLLLCFSCDYFLYTDESYLGYIRPVATYHHQNGTEYYFKIVTTKDNYDMRPTVRWDDIAYKYANGDGDYKPLSDVLYHIQFSTSKEFVTILEEDSLNCTEYKLQEAIGYDDEYKFRIRYLNNHDSISNWSDVFTLKIIERRVSQVYPEYGGEIDESNPKFIWQLRSFQDFDSAEYMSFHYHFKLFEGCGDNGQVVGLHEEAFIIGDTTYSIKIDLVSGKRYGWRVDYQDPFENIGKFRYECASWFTVK